MLKSVLFKLFISRAAPVLVQYIGKLLANGAIVAGGYLASHGVAAGDSLTMIAGGLTVLAGAVVEYVRIHYGDAVVEAVSK